MAVADLSDFPRLDIVPLDWQPQTPPERVQSLIEAAGERAERFLSGKQRLAEFVLCNLWPVYGALRALADQGLAPGRRFCEWGSGGGGACCLAALLGFDAWGVEIQPALVAQARRLARDHRLAARFVCGSYKPPDAYRGVIDPAPVRRQLGFDPFAADLVFAYPWPAERRVVYELFAELAQEGALLLAFHGGVDLQLARKSC